MEECYGITNSLVQKSGHYVRYNELVFIGIKDIVY